MPGSELVGVRKMSVIETHTEIAPAVGRTVRDTGRDRTVARFVLLALCLETIFSVAYRSVYLAVSSVPLAWVAGVAMVLVAGVVYSLRNRVGALCAGLAAWRPPRGWYVGWLSAGVVLRLLWHVVFHTIPRSDGRTYFNEASLLATEHRYGGAFFPPGLPLFEAPFFMMLGAHFWVASLCTLLLFVATFAVVRRLGRELGGEAVAAVACALVALWPNDVAAVGVNPKEALLAVLVTTALWLYLRSTRTTGGAQVGYALGAGVFTGCAALTQPAFLLFPSVMLGCELLWRGVTGAGLRRVMVLCVAMLAAIAPWSLRNYRLYHRPVLVTTNGGSVFYRANNPKANAQYEPEGAQKLGGDEFAASDEGYRAARLWIRQHPLDFANLMVRKQVVYLGDDSDRVYESIKRDQTPRGVVYAGLKLLANGFWMLLFLLLVPASVSLFRRSDWRLWYGIGVLPLLYQWCIDSVFEAGSRHHVPYLGLIGILVAMALLSAKDGAKQGSQGS